MEALPIWIVSNGGRVIETFDSEKKVADYLGVSPEEIVAAVHLRERVNGLNIMYLFEGQLKPKDEHAGHSILTYHLQEERYEIWRKTAAVAKHFNIDHKTVIRILKQNRLEATGSVVMVYFTSKNVAKLKEHIQAQSDGCSQPVTDPRREDA